MTIQQQTKERIRFEDIVDDLFGLNIRALVSVGTLFWNPKRYFQAADTSKWLGEQYTPSIRLWLSMMALVFLFQFFWAGENSPMVQMMATQLEAAGLTLPEGVTYTALAYELAGWAFAYMPFLIFFSLLAFAAVYPLWGQSTTVAQRLRYVFGVGVPSTTASVFTSFGLGLTPASQLQLYAVGTMLLTLFLDTLTSFRGPLSHLPLFGRLWRAILLALFIIMISMIANFAAQFLGGLTYGYLQARG